MATVGESSGVQGVGDVSRVFTQTTMRSNARRSAADATVAAADASTKIPPPEPFALRLAAVRAAANPLLEASRVLLRAQADMPAKLTSKHEIASLRTILEQELRVFQRLCEQSGIRRDHMTEARYCLCTALDEAAMQTEWGNGNGNGSGVEWITHGLATISGEDRQGGDKVYWLIGRLLAEPSEHYDLLEVIDRILSLGFEGRYRYEADGRRKHVAVRQRVYNEITLRRATVRAALSSSWQSGVKGNGLSFYDFPVWLSVTVLSIILLGCFGWFKYELLDYRADVQKQIDDPGLTMPSPGSPRLHLAQLLKDEIAAGTVSVDEDAHHSVVTFNADTMFPSGGASIRNSMAPLVGKIANEIAKVRGKVTVLGYTDDVPIRSGQFASNDALSEERAAQAMQILLADGVPENRLEAIGKGSADPVGDNRTAQGRAQNRRVEIHVAQ